MKLEVGMYVRLDRCQGIAKIDDYDEEYNIYSLDTEICDEWGYETFKLDESDVVKASFNITDIIEKGDYINGEWVNDIVNGKPFYEDYNDPYYSYGWDNEDIKLVITHEQMEQISYKVGE